MALNQYRDRATETVEELDSIKESEDRAHRVVRRRLRLASPEVKLTSRELEILARWRADVDLGGGLSGGRD
jgi:hypothetical protein